MSGHEQLAERIGDWTHACARQKRVWCDSLCRTGGKDGISTEMHHEQSRSEGGTLAQGGNESSCVMRSAADDVNGPSFRWIALLERAWCSKERNQNLTRSAQPSLHYAYVQALAQLRQL